ncbi:MAG: hypothetical protein EOP52_05075 [Sphingobacteriales bacterium]|nr:MAG: hypothetical protein EOP52_05075 [Sphingobacteriales bacterium]
MVVLFKKRFSVFIAGLLFGTSSVPAQKPAYTNLVFEGAGIRGIAYSGAIQELEAAGLMQPVRGFAGTSAGAITALLLSLGYKGAETEQIISETKFERFNDGRFFFIGGLHRLRKNFGWYRGKAFDAWLGQLIAAKTNDPDLSFDELYRRTGNELVITATSFNRQRVLYLSRLTYPSMRVRDAVRISMSIPLYFEAIRIDASGTIQPSGTPDDSLDLVGDGGMLANFPIAAFDTYDTSADGVIRRIPNPQTLGVRIDSDRQLQNDRTTHELAQIPIRSLRSYMGAFYVLTIESLNRQQLTADDWARTLSVSDAQTGPVIKKLTTAQKQRLIESGRNHTRMFLQQKGIRL